MTHTLRSIYRASRSVRYLKCDAPDCEAAVRMRTYDDGRDPDVEFLAFSTDLTPHDWEYGRLTGKRVDLPV